MNVSYQWLKSLVPFTWEPPELAARLTAVGLSVEQVTYFNKGMKNVVVGEVLSVQPHPDATKTKWHVLEVNDGKNILTIVCGAPNVVVGIKVALAKVGAELPGGITLDAVDKGGVISYGMLCSTVELELPEGLATAESEGGIFILPSDCTVGEDLVSALQLDDAILEFELTPNRADCLSVHNIAREVAAISGQPLTLPAITLPKGEKDIGKLVRIDVEAADLCPRYTGKMVMDVKIGPSPYWLRRRLAAAGIRAINNIVDIANYVMLEMNQPTHTFDYDQIAGHHIIVRRAKPGERIVTLDEIERQLDENMLLICDDAKAIGIAGVMGALNSEITAATKNILIESAAFYPKNIRQTYRKLGLPSEAASRFEKGINMEASERASERLCQLLCELAGGTLVEGTIDSYQGDFVAKKVPLNVDKVNATLGLAISAGEMEAIIKSLAFYYEVIEGGFEVTVPFYRQDISGEVDLVEEIARLYGYDKIPAALPLGALTEGKKTPTQKMEAFTKDIFTALGFNEIVTYSFINKKNYDDLSLAPTDPRRDSVTIMNPFSDEQGVMRTLLLPSILTVAARNMNRKNVNLSLFELAHVFCPEAGEKLPRETTHLVGLVSGSTDRGWNGLKEERDFFYLKGVVATYFAKLGLNDVKVQRSEDQPFLHPGRSCTVLVAGQCVGYLGEIHPSVRENYDLPNRAVVFEFDFSQLEAKRSGEICYEAVSKYPAVEVDIALLAAKEIKACDIEAVLRKVGGPYLKELALFDIYEGKGMLDGQHSLAYNLRFQARERTLTAEEINATVADMVESLKNQLGVELRS